MTPFNLKIITPDKIIFDDVTGNVIVRTTVGDKGILARHEPYVAALPVGKLRVMDDTGKYRLAAISTGTIRVEEGGDTVILVRSFEWREKIDVARAESEKELAEKQMADPNISDIEKEMAELKYKRAVNRLEVVNGDAVE